MPLPQFLDCTIRDGGYINGWDFSRHFATSLYHALSEAGADYMEIGFLSTDRDPKCPWQSVNQKDIVQLKEEVPDGAKIAVMINYGEVPIDAVPDATDFPTDLIRVATPKGCAREATDYAARLSQKGFATTINYMGISNYNNQDILKLIGTINGAKQDIRFFYLADSFGSLLPSRTREIFSTLQFGTDAKIGFHPHNNLQLAFANTLVAMEVGVDIVDGSIFGMGRGAGNLYTDAVLTYFETLEPKRYRVMPILQFADLYMDELKKQFDWGYSLPQLLSGILGCHPNYPTRLLKEKAYTADDIYRMLQELPETEKPRYSQEVSTRIKMKHFNLIARDEAVQVSDRLKELCAHNNQEALIICGGQTVNIQKHLISEYIQEVQPAVFSVNNPKAPLPAHGVFFGNRRRILQYWDQISDDLHVLFGSDIHPAAEHNFKLKNVTRLNLFQLITSQNREPESVFPSNSGIKAVLALYQVGFRNIAISGLDGYSGENSYYYDEIDQVDSEKTREEQNKQIAFELNELSKLSSTLDFTFSIITSTLFDRYAKSPS